MGLHYSILPIRKPRHTEGKGQRQDSDPRACLYVPGSADWERWPHDMWLLHVGGSTGAGEGVGSGARFLTWQLHPPSTCWLPSLGRLPVSLGVYFLICKMGLYHCLSCQEVLKHAWDTNVCCSYYHVSTHTPCTDSLLSLCRDGKHVAIDVPGHSCVCYVGLISPHEKME